MIARAFRNRIRRYIVQRFFWSAEQKRWQKEVDRGWRRMLFDAYWEAMNEDEEILTRNPR